MSAAAPLEADPDAPGPTFDAIYDAHLAFVWRNLRRLGVLPASLDDATQDVFLVIHRRLADAPPHALRAWIFGVTRRVAADHRRLRARKGATSLAEVAEPVARGPGPVAEVERAEAARLVHALLDRLDDAKREVFVLAELEQMPAPEIAAAIGIPINTVYSRLRAARAEFDAHGRRLALASAGNGPERGTR
ncbi:MAG: sigma-70 family RNA polymerase sigma factor [Kofleriaceae bacterium]